MQGNEERGARGDANHERRTTAVAGITKGFLEGIHRGFKIMDGRTTLLGSEVVESVVRFVLEVSVLCLCLCLLSGDEVAVQGRSQGGRSEVCQAWR